MTELLGFEKIGDIIGGRMAHQILRRIGLFESPFVHDRDAVRERDAVG